MASLGPVDTLDSEPSAVRRPTTPVLAATEWGDGSQPTVVLLHGILGSAEYWRDVAGRLPDHRVIAIDLLGFGVSPRPARVAYDYADHVGAVVATLEALGPLGPAILAGHSMGALIALRLAADRPELVSRLTLIGMPVFESAAAARKAIGRTRLRRALLYGPVSRLFCAVWCQASKPISRRIAPLYLRRVPAAVARATVDHSWWSYSRSLANIIENQSVGADLQRVTCPTLIVHGDQDQDASLPADRVPMPGFRTLVVPGDHHLPLDHPGDIADLLRTA
ncbi:MAG TPA: alpha/beta hydrolase [Nocardioides sp.]|uniref:alpha/beta fold hydrolase n=1 Tax=Nocardioides sp. TaxID=35761 RepID=UPI002E34107F|nr:alpha/beta hydrolase [Nocardioides sp.]HEX5087819.1 alpha/beta hydrolase [Nocardioides sp.]